MAATSQSLNFASQDLAELMAQANSGSGNLGYLVRDTSLKSQITRLGGHLDTLVTLRTQPVLDSIETLASSLTETSRLVNNLINDLDTLFVDSSVTRDLQATLHNLEQGTYKFDQNMEALQYSWPFRKFFRKKARKNK